MSAMYRIAGHRRTPRSTGSPRRQSLRHQSRRSQCRIQQAWDWQPTAATLPSPGYRQTQDRPRPTAAIRYRSKRQSNAAPPLTRETGLLPSRWPGRVLPLLETQSCLRQRQPRFHLEQVAESLVMTSHRPQRFHIRLRQLQPTQSPQTRQPREQQRWPYAKLPQPSTGLAGRTGAVVRKSARGADQGRGPPLGSRRGHRRRRPC